MLQEAINNNELVTGSSNTSTGALSVTPPCSVNDALASVRQEMLQQVRNSLDSACCSSKNVHCTWLSTVQTKQTCCVRLYGASQSTSAINNCHTSAAVDCFIMQCARDDQQQVVAQVLDLLQMALQAAAQLAQVR